MTDIFGGSGSGKTQICFTLAVNCLRDGGKVVYVDTVGNFRPERILEIGGDSEMLERITYLRVLGTADQTLMLKTRPSAYADLIIVDSATALFSVEFAGAARHLALMKYLHDLALLAIASRSAVVFTNMIRDAPGTSAEQSKSKIQDLEISSRRREYLGSSVSIYSHFKLKLETINAEKSHSRAELIHPPSGKGAEFVITSRGITDVT
jgi:RecA/RadA recombinase